MLLVLGFTGLRFTEEAMVNQSNKGVLLLWLTIASSLSILFPMTKFILKKSSKDEPE